MSPTRAGLARAYERAVYIAELPDGPVEFRLHAAPRGPAPAGTLAIVTAWNPGAERPSEAANAEANRRLEDALKSSGRSHYAALGRSEDGRHVEPSFAVVDIDPASALELARAFRQAAVFYWDGSAASLLWCEP